MRIDYKSKTWSIVWMTPLSAISSFPMTDAPSTVTTPINKAFSICHILLSVDCCTISLYQYYRRWRFCWIHRPKWRDRHCGLEPPGSYQMRRDPTESSSNLPGRPVVWQGLPKAERRMRHWSARKE